MTDTTGTNLPATVDDGPEIPVGALTARTREDFDLAARKVAVLAQADILPKEYRNTANVLVALDIAERTGIPLLSVCQNLHIIKGRPGWGSPFLIAAVNQCGRFSRLRFELTGEGEERGCRCTAEDLATGETLEGERITLAAAREAGWTRNSPIWKTVPGQMLRYRAAAFWARVHAPEISQGLLTREELFDIPTARREDRLAEAQASLG